MDSSVFSSEIKPNLTAKDNIERTSLFEANEIYKNRLKSALDFLSKPSAVLFSKL